jgi:predicted methyltransferase
MRPLGCLAFMITCSCLATCPAAAQTPGSEIVPEANINAKFLNPELDPQNWVERFEVESRELFAARAEIVDSIGLKPGSRVADVGAGTGAFLRPLVDAVGSTGRVYAVDISPRLVEFVRQRVQDEKLATVAVILSTADSTTLPAGSVSHVVVCETYHHFEQYPEMLASIRQALVPGGRLVIVDFERIPGVSSDWTLSHVRAGKETVRAEVEAAGFEFVDEVDLPTLKESYVFRFRVPTSAP